MDQTSGGKNQLLRRLFLIISVLLFLLLPCVLCSYTAVAYVLGLDLTCWQVQNLRGQFLQDNAKFILPSSAQDVEIATRSGNDWCAIAVKFTMNPAELEAFVSSTQVSGLSETTEIEWGEDPHAELVRAVGLDVSAVRTRLFAYSNEDYLDQQYVFVDTSDSQHYAVYVIREIGWAD